MLDYNREIWNNNDVFKNNRLDICKFLIKNNLKFENKDWVWTGEEFITDKYTFDMNCELIIEEDAVYLEDCDGICFILSRNGESIIEEMEAYSDEDEVETIDDIVKSFLDSYDTEELKALLEHFKFIQENADLFNRI